MIFFSIPIAASPRQHFHSELTVTHVFVGAGYGYGGYHAPAAVYGASYGGYGVAKVAAPAVYGGMIPSIWKK